MMDWEILGISPTKDLRELKSAYSRALRVNHPDKNPEGFRRLREAYERLLAELSSPREALPSPDVVFAEPDLPEPQSRPEGTQAAPAMAQIDLEPLQEEWQQFWHRSERINPIAWKAFFSRREFWDIRTKRQFGDYLLRYLQAASEAGKLETIPKQAWLVLENTFDWLAREIELGDRFDPEFIDDVMDRIRQAGPQIRRPVTETAHVVPIPVASIDPQPGKPHQHTPVRKRSPRPSNLWNIGILSALLIALVLNSLDRDRTYDLPSQTSSADSRPDSLNGFDPDHPPEDTFVQFPIDSVVPFDAFHEAPRRIEVPRIWMKNWAAGFGGLLRGYCGDPEKDPMECPSQTTKAVRFELAQGALRLDLILGGVKVNGIRTSRDPCESVRLCTVIGTHREVIGLFDTRTVCNLIPARAWEIRNGRLARIAPALAVCPEEPHCEKMPPCRE
ncbi:MAG: hypothetical protein RL318_2232 [Fibrobacterota bacterium]|jgi:hypothetical protein